MRTTTDRPALLCAVLLLLFAAAGPVRAQERPLQDPSAIRRDRQFVAAGFSSASPLAGSSRPGRSAALLQLKRIRTEAPDYRVLGLGQQAAPATQAGIPQAPRVRDFGRALGYDFTRGLFSRKNLKPLLIGSAASLAIAPFDRRTSNAVRGDFAELGKSGKVIGAPVTLVPLTGVLVIAAPMTKSVRYRSFAFSETQAVVLANAQVFALKAMVRRTRPDASNEYSFPSAHAANIFALATVTSHYYGKKIGIPLYIVACLVAASRVERGSHFPSDVIFGAMLGYISGKTAIRGTEHIVQNGHKVP